MQSLFSLKLFLQALGILYLSITLPVRHEIAVQS